jgi:hypothetical protein
MRCAQAALGHHTTIRRAGTNATYAEAARRAGLTIHTSPRGIHPRTVLGDRVRLEPSSCREQRSAMRRDTPLLPYSVLRHRPAVKKPVCVAVTARAAIDRRSPMFTT